MFRRIAVCGLAALASTVAALAQEAVGPTFVVASIKPAAPMEPGRIMIGVRGGPGTQDPGQITVSNMSVRDLIMSAFNVKSYQITGPASLDSPRWDVSAKVPPGATKDDVNVMMQNLLKERFGLAVHRETKEMSMLALVVGKNGPKLKESEPDPPQATGDGPPPDGPPPIPAGPPKIGKDGMPEFPPGMRRQGMMMMMMPGRMRLVATKMPIARLVDNLARQYDKPVVDQTGLTKNYDFTLDFIPEQGMMKGMPAPPPGAMTAPPPGGGDGMMHVPEASEVAPLSSAIQEQLGLKLEPKKGPVEMVVIDHIEKSPTEN